MLPWSTLLKSAIVGADRTASEAASTGRLLEAMATTRLLQRAAPTLAIAPGLPEAAPADERPLCSPGAVRDLRMMLRGTYAEGLGEFFALLDRHGQRLPPECLPELLDRAAKDKNTGRPGPLVPFPATLGPLARWLALQNPAWRALAEDSPAPDWRLAAFPDRLRLLRAMRQTDPAAARAWIEETWAQETAEHRAAFLTEFAAGLSAADAPLLESVRHTDRARSVRLIAFGLLMRLPESVARREAQTFFWQYLAAALDPGKRESALRLALPDLTAPALQFYAGLLPTAGSGRWREELLHLLLRWLPPDALLQRFWKDPSKLLRRLAEDTAEPEALSAVLEAAAWHRSEAWLQPALERCAVRSDHPVWQTAGPAALLAAFPVNGALYLLKSEGITTALLPRIAEALRIVDSPWPLELLRVFIGAVESAWGGVFYDWNNPPNWLLTVRTAAYHCRLDDAEALQAQFHETFAPRPGPLQLFYDIVRFRKRLQQHFN